MAYPGVYPSIDGEYDCPGRTCKKRKHVLVFNAISLYAWEGGGANIVKRSNLCIGSSTTISVSDLTIWDLRYIGVLQ